MSALPITVTRVITGELKSKIDRVWDAFWSGGISNPMEVIEQVTYLLFIRRLDELQLLAESKHTLTGAPVGNVPFRPGQEYMRWSVFKDEDPDDMFAHVGQVFEFLKTYGDRLGGPESDYSRHMRDARFTIPTPNLLVKVVEMLDGIPMEDRDTNGDLYEYLLSKLSQSGTNGQFRTPRHIINQMVAMMAPTPTDTICDPACGTAGFLISASEFVRDHHDEVATDARARHHFHHEMFHGFDFDSTMLRIGSMNMLMHGIEGAEITYRDSLAAEAGTDKGSYSMVLANPPFAGSLDYQTTSPELLSVVKTKKTELLFLALFIQLLSLGGRAAVIVPDGVLFGSSKAHKTLRKMLVTEQKLEAVVKLPSGVFKPYAGVSTAILFFTRTDSTGDDGSNTDFVWFYEVTADGFSLDDRRSPISDNDLPDLLERWDHRNDTERDHTRTDQSFCVPAAEIAEQDYDLSLNRYKEIVYDEVEHRAPSEIIADIEALDTEIAQGMAELKAMLG